jgi:tyrosyl-tRNA synthetase
VDIELFLWYVTTCLRQRNRIRQFICQIGGATGLVGDPSGRASERQPADPKIIEENVLKLEANVNRFFSRARKYAEKRLPLSGIPYIQANILNNLSWLKDLNLLEFLRTVGPSVRVNTMLNRERYVISR